MIEHHIQKEIVHRLVLADGAHFAQLKPKSIDGNLFTYHLKQLIVQKYVTKTGDGHYRLTALGKQAGVSIKLSEKDKLEQAHAILLLAVHGEDGAWLLRKRLAQPTYGQIGFIHGEPAANQTVIASAKATLKRRTDLAADFVVAGHGFVKISNGGEFESFVCFTMLEATIKHAELPSKTDETGENIWLERPDFDSKDMIASMPALVKLLDGRGKNLFFADLAYNL